MTIRCTVQRSRAPLLLDPHEIKPPPEEME